MEGLIMMQLLFLGIYLLINYVVAGYFVEIAAMKGHQGDHYFWCCFLLSFVGYLLVIALPNVNETKNTTETKSEEKMASLPKL